MKTIPDTMDLRAYQDEEKFRQVIRSMKDWREEAKELMLVPPSQRGAVMPWEKSHGCFRFRPAELTLWGGESGSGKSAMISEVMLGLAAQTERSMIVSLEMEPVLQVDRAVRQFSRRGDPRVSDLDAMLEWTDGKVWLYDHVGQLSLDRLLPAMRWAAAELRVKHIVIDSLMRLNIAETDYDAQKAAINRLVTFRKDAGVHVHLVAHSRKPGAGSMGGSKHEIKGTGTIADLTDNVIMVVRNREKEQKIADGEATDSVIDAPDSFAVVAKQRNGTGWEGPIRLWYDPACMRWMEAPAHRAGAPCDLRYVGGVAPTNYQCRDA